mmetsp:Transcript_122614/g.391993  ORF Transcript_122614/g.391993 Transcript_122614/m.391993 type:complete len:321 (-) Transcript_122614:20-982(-)
MRAPTGLRCGGMVEVRVVPMCAAHVVLRHLDPHGLALARLDVVEDVIFMRRDVEPVRVQVSVVQGTDRGRIHEEAELGVVKLARLVARSLTQVVLQDDFQGLSRPHTDGGPGNGAVASGVEMPADPRRRQLSRLQREGQGATQDLRLSELLVYDGRLARILDLGFGRDAQNVRRDAADRSRDGILHGILHGAVDGVHSNAGRNLDHGTQCGLDLKLCVRATHPLRGEALQRRAAAQPDGHQAEDKQRGSQQERPLIPLQPLHQVPAEAAGGSRLCIRRGSRLGFAVVDPHMSKSHACRRCRPCGSLATGCGGGGCRGTPR